MLMHLHPQIIAVKTPLLVLSFIIIYCDARVLIDQPERSPILSVMHNEDEVPIQGFDYHNIMENDEVNEVISVRLLNSKHSKSYPPSSAELQSVSYDSVQENSTKAFTAQSTEKLHHSIVESTTSTQLNKTFPKPASEEHSLEKDWVRARIQIPISSEEDGNITPASIKMTTRPTQTTSTQRPSLTTSPKPQTTSKTPLVYGYRRRRARNYNYYDELPDVDFDQIDLTELENTEINGKRLKDIIAQEYVPTEKSRRSKKRRTKKKPTTSTTTACPCAAEIRQQIDDYAVDYYTDDVQYADHQQRRPPVSKRLINQQNRLPPSEDYLEDHNSSIERVERVQGALERIMGIVTIMSHVDSFIHKKTKQSIRRLAKLYESVEE